MQLVLIILIVIGGCIVVGGVILVLLRLRAAWGMDERGDYMAGIAAEHDGEFVRAGLMGQDTVTFRHNDVTGKIMFVQNVSTNQTRRLTHIIFKRPAAFTDLVALSAGASLPPPFSPSLPPNIRVIPHEMPSGVEFFSTDIDGARWLNVNYSFQTFIKKLIAMTGLAKFELYQKGQEFKFAIDGFIMVEEQLMELYNLLLEYVKQK